MKCGVRRHNCTHRTWLDDENVQFWKYNIAYGRHFENRYIHISDANRPNLTEVGTQTQILTQPMKHDKHKSEINIKTANITFKNY